MNIVQQTYQKPATSDSKEAVIIISKLVKKFAQHTVLNEFSLTLQKEESLVVLGRSGSGKSVLIKCIIGLMKPDAGDIEVLGENILSLNKEELDKLRTRVGFLFQSNALYDSMTIRENLEFSVRRHREDISDEELEKRVMEVLTNVGLPHTVDMMPNELSGGMQKRIALARTLILNPEIILYDEPTSGLDPVTGKEISTLIVEVQKKYRTSSIIISHDIACVKRVADRIAVLADGKCYATGTYEMLERSDDTKIKQFFE